MVALALVIVCCTRAAALDPTRSLTQALHRTWQVFPGLPHATIFAIRQTHDGYLWLGTQKGLVRFDGVGFSGVENEAGRLLNDLWIQNLHEDNQHNLWIATDASGLMRLREGDVTRYGRSDGLPSDDVRCVLTDRDGQVWVGTADGVARLDQRFVSFYASDGLASNDIRAMCLARDGKLWLGGEGNQLSMRSGSSFTTSRLESLPADAAVRALSCARDGSLWVGSNKGLVRLKDGEERRYTTADGVANDDILCLTEGQNGSLWVGTKQGFSRLEKDEFESFRPTDGLSQSSVYALCEDREGSLWVGTKHGLNQFMDRRTILYTTREGLPSNDTGPVLQDAAGTIWVGTLGAGLARFDGRRFSALTTDDGLASNTIFTLASGDDGDVWIGTERGLSRLHEGRIVDTFTTADGLPSSTVRCLCRDHRGSLWVGTAGGIVEWRDGRFAAPAGDPAALRAPLRALLETRDGVLLAAAEQGGLYALVDGRFTPLADADLKHRDIETFYRDVDGGVWIGTRGSGLFLLENEKTFHVTTRRGLFDDDIFGIVADDQDRLWMACSKGIFYVERQELKKLAAGKINAITSTPFSPTDALRTIECKGGVQPSVWKMQDGQVWFSTIRGLIVIDPERLQRDIPPIPVVVEDVIVNGKTERPDQFHRLPPGPTNLEFRYTALSFLSPARLTFRYRLVGFDTDWIEAGQRREAFYTNLAPGDYRFEVAARTTDGNYQEAELPVAFTLEPSFYQTRWFWPLCGSLAALLAWAAYRLRIRRIKERMKLVVAERSRIARELHDTLMQGFAGVTMEMQALAARLSPSDERSTLDEIIGDAGHCLSEARRSVAGLRSPPSGESGLKAALAQVARQITETQDMRLKLRLQTGPQGLAPDVEYNLLHIAQEALTNSVKHSGGRTIEVALDCSPRELQLSIEDDGIGFAAHNGTRSQPGHYGLVGMRERASQIGAELLVESTAGRGTTVRVLLPMTPHASAAATASHS